MKILVLGAGLVGAPMAMDLAADKRFRVTVADISAEALKKVATKAKVTTCRADLSEVRQVKKLAREADMVVNAVPGFLGYQTLKAVIESKKNAVDIAFFPEDFFLLDDLARRNKVTVLSDIGVAPGMSNILTGYASHLLDKTEKVRIYVGGLPKVREWPYEYKAVFSPYDVIEEYTRPARLIENGKVVYKPALSDPELICFPEVGTLEAFNTDGLRSLAKTIDAPNMVEKTMRYPGHIGIMKVLRETGFFNKQEVDVGGRKVRPLDLSAKLLLAKWKLREGEEDITVMRILIEGVKGKKRVEHAFNLLDRYDPKTGIHSMARTTGYTATAALRMVVDGLYKEPGVSAPEYIGRKPACVQYLLKALKAKGIVYHHETTKLD